MATLYRNFPGRRELLEALYTDEVDAICNLAEAFEAKTPGARLNAWLHEFFVFFNSKQQVASELLKDSDGSNPLLGQSRSRVIAAGRPLLAAAQQSLEVRDELTLEQILDMVGAVAKISGGRDYLMPILETALKGLSLLTD